MSNFANLLSSEPNPPRWEFQRSSPHPEPQPKPVQPISVQLPQSLEQAIKRIGVQLRAVNIGQKKALAGQDELRLRLEGVERAQGEAGELDVSEY